jgi:preprotein translocase subunit SecE
VAEIYKEGHGVLVRRVAFVGLATLLVWGGIELYGWLMAIEWFRHPDRRWVNYRIPVVHQFIDPAFVISWLVIIGGCILIYRLLNKPRSADFLIETDTEVRKVTWPTWNDAWNSSLIVLLFVLVVTGFIFFSDWVINLIMKLILRPQGA